MKTTADDGMNIQIHLGKPKLISTPPVETWAFNKRITKIVVNANDLQHEEENVVLEEQAGVADVELEEERERIRKEEEIHPDVVKKQSCL